MVQFGVEEEDREVAVEEHPAVAADLGIAVEEGVAGEAPGEAVVVEAADSVQVEVGDEVAIQISRELEDQVEGEVHNPGVRRYGAKKILGGPFHQATKSCKGMFPIYT